MKAAQPEHAEARGVGLVDIGAAAAASGVSAKMIRHYEAIGLMPQARRTQANYRLYSDADVNTLRFIRRARSLGFSIDEIRRLLALWQDRRRSSAAVKTIAREHIADLRAKIDELESMVGALEHLVRCCRGDHRPECPILDDLASNRS